MNTVTIKPVILHYQRATESYNVKLRVTFKRRARYLPTTVTVYSKDLTRGGKLKDCPGLAKAEELRRSILRQIGEVSPFKLDEWDVDDVVAYIQRSQGGEAFCLPFCTFCRDFLTADPRKPQTKSQYYTAVRHFEDFAGDIDINSISASLLRDFVAYCDKRGKTVAYRMMLFLQYLFGKAKEKYNDEDNDIIRISRDPFSRVTVDRMCLEGKRALDAATIQRLIDYRTDDPRRRLAVDAVLLSFGLMGANLADLWAAVPPKEGVWVYHRAKTASRRQDGAEMRVMVEECLGPAIARQKGRNGRDWFCFQDRWHRIVGFDHAVLRYIAVVAEELGVPRFTSYSLRKAWATQARRLGIEKALVDECLAHVGDFRLVDIYAERNWEGMWEANRKVLAQFNWDGLRDDRTSASCR